MKPFLSAFIMHLNACDIVTAVIRIFLCLKRSKRKCLHFLSGSLYHAKLKQRQHICT